jgi:hypothetical protein
MSANTHGGAEVLNYPWDTWSRVAADNNWWIFVCRQYVDTVHLYSPSTYFDGFNNGITNGYAWYTISGGRQDYMNYFHNCREVTMEISDIKKPTASTLPNYWNWNYRSLLNYMEQCTFGISGLVTNLQNDNPVKAQVLIQGHDLDNSFVYSDSVTGHYKRLLEAGTYNLTFIADGLTPIVFNNINVTRYNTTTLNVQLGYPEILMSTGNIETCSSLFYDSGGESNNYQNNENHVLTFLAPFSGSKIFADFLEFEVETDASCNKDWLKIYNGISVSAPLIGKFCGTSSPGQISATNADGALTFEFHSDNSATKPGWKALIFCESAQNIQLKAGWNGLSTFVQPYETDPESLFENILGDIEIIQGENGSFVPGQPNNTLINWNFEKGYQIKLLNVAEVNVTGLFNTPISINLYEGWNLIPALFPYPISVDGLINGLNDQILIIKEATGFQVYWPSAEIHTLQFLQPGNSYFIKVSEDIILTFPNSGIKD